MVSNSSNGRHYHLRSPGYTLHRDINPSDFPAADPVKSEGENVGDGEYYPEVNDGDGESEDDVPLSRGALLSYREFRYPPSSTTQTQARNMTPPPPPPGRAAPPLRQPIVPRRTNGILPNGLPSSLSPAHQYAQSFPNIPPQPAPQAPVPAQPTVALTKKQKAVQDERDQHSETAATITFTINEGFSKNYKITYHAKGIPSYTQSIKKDSVPFGFHNHVKRVEHPEEQVSQTQDRKTSKRSSCVGSPTKDTDGKKRRKN
ncbi:hypothetical protein EJ02DRAFT_516465 [Clathrospora elynae]|uniref:Uncharacterized protein n=1 Tax=Clathrospora elynae TaxID=706981 RepID=A0A6A5S6K6_9PLEO|nr:hypothetical protein EJ02DRAFT_516465 [Clathrospora elynae]